jgi:hypothetical protein
MDWQGVYLGKRFRLMTPQDHQIVLTQTPATSMCVGVFVVSIRTVISGGNTWWNSAASLP